MCFLRGLKSVSHVLKMSFLVHFWVPCNPLTVRRSAGLAHVRQIAECNKVLLGLSAQLQAVTKQCRTVSKKGEVGQSIHTSTNLHQLPNIVVHMKAFNWRAAEPIPPSPTTHLLGAPVSGCRSVDAAVWPSR
jgi:hypothetical protein